MPGNSFCQKMEMVTALWSGVAVRFAVQKRAESEKERENQEKRYVKMRSGRNKRISHECDDGSAEPFRLE